MAHENDGKLEESVPRASLPIAEVTLLEDRARVLRRGSVTVGEGPSSFLVDSVAPAIADKTVLVRVKHGDARVSDLRVRRRLVVSRGDAEAEPGSVDELAARNEELENEIKRLLDQKTALEDRAAAIDELAHTTFSDFSEDVAWGRKASAEGWQAAAKDLQARERELRKSAADLAHKLKDLYAEHDRLAVRLAATSDASRTQWAGVEIMLEGQGAGPVELELEYSVPGACWRPIHVARLNSEASSVGFSTDACVWQNTGEEWDEVLLRFSTERASLGASPPELTSDVLRLRKRSTQVVVETREQEVQTTGLGNAGAPVSSDLPGIDDGGELVTLSSGSKVTVPSDGRPHRVRIGEFESSAEVDLVAMSELSPAVVTRSIQTNRAKTPILAGPVELIRDSGFVGRSSVLFVAPGEQFELGWGPDAELRIRRETDTFPEKSRMLSSWLSRRSRVDVYISNIGPAERTIKVTERVPVSEIDKVKIEMSDASSPRTNPDERGFVTWELTLPAFSQEKRTLEFVLKKHEDVVGI